MSDWQVQLINESTKEFEVDFHGPEGSTQLHSCIIERFWSAADTTLSTFEPCEAMHVSRVFFLSSVHMQP
jgi:hypothetical protein